MHRREASIVSFYLPSQCLQIQQKCHALHPCRGQHVLNQRYAEGMLDRPGKYKIREANVGRNPISASANITYATKPTTQSTRYASQLRRGLASDYSEITLIQEISRDFTRFCGARHRSFGIIRVLMVGVLRST